MKMKVTRPRPSGLRREKVFAVLPTLLTLGNAACGFGSITFAAKVGPEASGNPLFVAGLMIVFAMVFDMLDGHAARLTRHTSQFGAELDSLCDAISVGAAPAFLMLKFPQVYHPRLLWMIAVLFMLCVVLRLARFNVETDEEDTHDTFSGLPSPAAAAMVASVAIVLPGIEGMTDPSMSLATQKVGTGLLEFVYYVLPILTLALAFLMVSRIRYPHLFNQLFRGRRSFRQLVQLVFAAAAVIVIHELALPVIVGYFVLGSPLRAAWSEMAKRRQKAAGTPSLADADPGAATLTVANDLQAEP
jgi:CDP-diacylglycerol--serine O-phosphatidyltransferase